MNIELKVLNKQFYEDYQLPHYQTQGSAAIDLVCTEDVTIYPGECKMIPTGLAMHIGSERAGIVASGGKSDGLNSAMTHTFHYAGLILPRSGLGTKGLVLANTIGLIDEDYQGELMVSALNRHRLEDNEYYDGEENWACTNMINLKAGDRFAQLMFIPVIRAQFDIVDEFSSSTNRGAGGFGHTGV